MLNSIPLQCRMNTANQTGQMNFGKQPEQQEKVQPGPQEQNLHKTYEEKNRDERLADAHKRAETDPYWRKRKKFGLNSPDPETVLKTYDRIHRWETRANSDRVNAAQAKQEARLDAMNANKQYKLKIENCYNNVGPRDKGQLTKVLFDCSLDKKVKAESEDIEKIKAKEEEIGKAETRQKAKQLQAELKKIIKPLKKEETGLDREIQQISNQAVQATARQLFKDGYGELSKTERIYVAQKAPEKPDKSINSYTDAVEATNEIAKENMDRVYGNQA